MPTTGHHIILWGGWGINPLILNDSAHHKKCGGHVGGIALLLSLHKYVLKPQGSGGGEAQNLAASLARALLF